MPYALSLPPGFDAKWGNLQLPAKASDDVVTVTLDCTGWLSQRGAVLTGVTGGSTNGLGVSAPVATGGVVSTVLSAGQSGYVAVATLALALAGGDTLAVPLEIRIASDPAGNAPLPPVPPPVGPSIVSASVTNTGHLVLVRDNGSAVDAGNVIGPPGDPGPPGSSGSALVTMTAAATISGHRVLMVAAGGVVHANPATLFAFAGISTQAVVPGAPVLVAEDGQTVTEPSWAWTPGTPLFVAAGGLLTATPPTSGISQQVAVATAATSILVQPFAPIRLS